MMTTQCFENDTGTNITTKCQHPSLNKFNELVPVTSLRTRLTYWNEYCVECNADADDLVPWNVKIAVEIDSEILTSLWSMNKNYKELIEMMSKSKALDFRYLPQIPNSGQQCIIKQYLRTCEHSSQPDYTHTPDWLFEACARFHNPAYIRNIKPSSFMNIFCFFCRPTSLPNIKGLNCKVFWTKKELPGQITALLDYKSVSALETETANDQPLKGDGTCACDEVFDNYKVKYTYILTGTSIQICK